MLGRKMLVSQWNEMKVGLFFMQTLKRPRKPLLFLPLLTCFQVKCANLTEMRGVGGNECAAGGSLRGEFVLDSKGPV